MQTFPEDGDPARIVVVGVEVPVVEVRVVVVSLEVQRAGLPEFLPFSFRIYFSVPAWTLEKDK